MTTNPAPVLTPLAAPTTLLPGVTRHGTPAPTHRPRPVTVEPSTRFTAVSLAPATATRFGTPAAVQPVPSPVTLPRAAYEVSAWSLVAVAAAVLTLFVWPLALVSGGLGVVAIARERHLGSNQVGYGIAALGVALAARLAMRTFETYGPLF